MQVDVRIQQTDFSGDTENTSLRSAASNVGAIVNFIGYVRGDDAGQSVVALELEHYPGMTENAIASIVAEAAQRWQVLAAKVIHRVGRLLAGEQIVYVGVASQHRSDCFAACEFIMDYLKTGAPIWKKELGLQGERWLDAHAKDTVLANRWNDLDSAS